MKEKILNLLFTFFTISLIAQINNKEDAIKTMNWLLENPQINSKEVFENKVNEIGTWKLNNTQNPNLHIKEKMNFINKFDDFKYSNEIFYIYDYGDYVENFENVNYDEKLSELYCVRGILKYYKNLIKLDKTFRNEFLDEIVLLSDKELSNRFM